MKIDEHILPDNTAEMFEIIRKYPGSTMSELHALGYRLIFTYISDLIRWEEVFEFENRYYPND
jgi:hypothetical protein